MMIKKELFLILTFCLIGMGQLIGQTSGSRPNIIVIVADDLGYSDVGYNRNEDFPEDLGVIPTPNLDALASQGIICTNAHVAHPFCGPSRTSILTGIYPHRIGAQYNLPNDITSEIGIPESETYFSKLIDDASYNTMALGKWHLGFKEGKYQPMDRGFDEFFGFLGGGKNYFRSEYDNTWYKYKPTDPEYSNPDLYNEPKDNHTTNEYQDPLQRGRDYVDRKEFGLEEYLTDVLTDQAIDFVDRKAGDSAPFFMYVAYNAPHTPLQAPQSEIDAFKSANPNFENLIRNSEYITQSTPVTKLPENEQATMIEELVQDRIIYATMVANMDTNIGRLVDKLNTEGVLENTMIVFFSDNGGYRFSKGAVNYPLESQKGSVDEGGHRVPFFVHWPAKIQTPADYDYQISALDLYPTLVNLAGGTIPADKTIDGVDFMDKMIAGENARPNKSIYVLRPQNGFHNAAVVSYPYRMTKKGGNGSWKLFDVNVNPEVQLTGSVGGSTAGEIINSLEESGANWTRDFYDVKPGWFDHERGDGHPHRILWFGVDNSGNTADAVFADYDRTFNYDSHPLSVSGVGISPPNVSLEPSETVSLTATVEPSYAPNQSVTWSSNNEEVATVDAQGLVTGVANGEAIITVTTVDGGYTASATVVVASKVLVTGVSLSPSSSSLSRGDTIQFTATIAPSNADDQLLIWSSNNETVATVDSKGELVAVGDGEATITVTTNDGGFTANATINVSSMIAVESVEITPATMTLEVGQKVGLNVKIEPSNASDQTVIWSTENDLVATVSATGVLTAVGAGETQVIVTTTDGSFSAAANIVVTGDILRTNTPIKGWKIYPNPISQERLTVRFHDERADRLIIRDIMGAMVKGVEVSDRTEISLSISDLDLNQGIYFIEVHGGSGRSIQKLVVK